MEHDSSAHSHDADKHHHTNGEGVDASNATPNVAIPSVEDDFARDSDLAPTSGQTRKKRKECSDGLEQQLPPTKKFALDSNGGSGSGRSTPSGLKKRGVSPPWKRVAADGPSSVMVDGKRKSTRNNAATPETPQPEAGRRRTTRGATQPDKKKIDYAPKNGYGRRGAANGKAAVNGKASTPQETNGKRGQKNGIDSNFKMPNKRQGRWPSNRTSQTRTKASSPGATRSGSNRFATPVKERRDSKSTTSRAYPRRSRRTSDTHPETPLANGHSANSQTVSTPAMTNGTPTSGSGQRLRLRFKAPTLRTLHPDNIPKPRRFASFADWLEQDDPLEGEKEKRYTDVEAREEALLRLRILDEMKPGGFLSEGRSSLYLPDPQDEDVPTAYGHWAHVTAHAFHFRRLLHAEHRQHLAAAKRTAAACQHLLSTDSRFKSVWNALQVPLTEEEAKEQELGYQLKRYKQLVKDLEQRWDLAKIEVNKIRMERWEEEQQRRGKEALDEMLDKSTALLDQRRHRLSSEIETDLDEDDDEDDFDQPSTVVDMDATSSRRASTLARSLDERGSDDEQVDDIRDEQLREGSSDPDNMSSSGDSDEEESVGDDDEDANLSPEALRRKYAEALQAEATGSEDGENEDKDEDVPTDDEHDDEDGEDSDDSGEDDISDTTNANGHSLSALLLPNGDDAKSSEQNDQEDNEETPSEAARGDSGYSTLDPAAVEVEEVDPMLLEDSDDSGSPTEESSEDDEDGETGVSEDDEEEEEEDEEEDNDLWGFFSKSKRKEIQETETVHTEDMTDEARVKDEQSEDAASASNIEMADGELDEVQSIEEQSSGSALKSRVDLPSVLLRGTLREYQHDGLDWLAGLYANDTNGILADEMGLGKTIQTISLLAHLAIRHEIWGPHLVVVPTSVMLNWEMEFKKWCPGFKILTYYGTQDERKKKRAGWMNNDKWNVVITSYQLILQDSQAFKKRGWHYLILDEAHNIKNFQTQRWQTLLTFKTHSRLLLTGTPLQNNLSELWSLLFFLMPSGIDGSGGFAELEHFINATRRPADQILEQGRQKLDAQAQAAVNKLHEVLRPYLLRRLKADVEKQMPAKHEHVVYCRLSKRQRQLYDTYMGRADTKATLSSGNYMSIINCLMSLRKVCNHPDLFETRQIVTSFAMKKSVVADYEIKELLVRKKLLEEDPLEQIDLVAVGLNLMANEQTSATKSIRVRQLNAVGPLTDLIERQTRRLKPETSFSGTSVDSTLTYLRAKARQEKFDHIQRCLRITKERMDRKPIYGTGLIERLTLEPSTRPISEPPKQRSKLTEWYLSSSEQLRKLVPSLEQRSQSLNPIIQRFGCTTPAVVAGDMPAVALAPSGVESVQALQTKYPQDPFHDARIRLSIQFPDKRLLQYDCGKLQRLDLLLRQLQARGSRALIFTQMTKVLDILEQFLNIHGHRYLRLDGATKIEQRQILTDRFNNDPRILAFILSSRSGGLGINLTGADTVIFYDLDWNPAMDKQCQDRCHRIGQTRDVHIYRFVSEFTIEANILRKSNQKRLLDDVIIQKGEFTTDYFNRVTYRDALDDELAEGDAEASAAMDKVLGDVTGMGQVLESVEDKEDAAAAKVAQREMSHVDDADFNESTQPSITPKTSVPLTLLMGLPAMPGVDDDEKPHVDDYMVRWLLHDMKDIPIRLPGDKDKRRPKKPRDHRRR